MKYPQEYIENTSPRSVSPQTETYMLDKALYTFFTSLAAEEKNSGDHNQLQHSLYHE